MILKDVLGYSIEEIGRLIDTSDMAVKAALHRGRARLCELSAEHEAPPPLSMESAERARLRGFADLAGRGRSPRSRRPPGAERQGGSRQLLQQLCAGFAMANELRFRRRPCGSAGKR